MSKYLIILIIFFVIIIVSFAVYFFFIKKSSQQEEKPPTKQEEKPPAKQEEKPPAKQEEKPPAKQEEKPPAKKEEKPPTKQEEKPPSKKEEKPPSQQEANKPVNALCQGGDAGTPEADPTFSNKEGNYIFSTVAKLGRDILAQFIKFVITVTNRIFIKNEIEKYALLEGTTNDINILDPNKYYQIGTLTKSNTVNSSKFGGATCKEFPPQIYKLIFPINATCKTSDTDLYDIPNDSRNVCNISKSDGFYKRGNRKSDIDITIKPQLYGGTTCSSQASATKDIKCGPINAVCKTSDIDLYDIPVDSINVCTIYDQNQDKYYKQAIKKTNDATLTSLPAINGGLNCTSQVPATKNILCGPINAVCKTSDIDLYDIPPDSQDTCNILKSDGWYKVGTLKQDSNITISNSINGGSTCISQLRNSLTKQFNCGPVDAECTTDVAKLYPNPPPDSTTVCGYKYPSPYKSKLNPIYSTNPNTTTYKTGTIQTFTYYIQQKQAQLTTNDTSITIKQQKNGGQTCVQKTPAFNYVDCGPDYNCDLITTNDKGRFTRTGSCLTK
jgi:hypothetical protein